MGKDDIQMLSGDYVGIQFEKICDILYRLGKVEGYLLNEMRVDPEGIPSLMVDYCRDVHNQIMDAVNSKMCGASVNE